MSNLLLMMSFFLLGAHCPSLAEPDPAMALQSAVQNQRLSLVAESAYRRIQSILFFLSDAKGLEMQASLIRELGPDIDVHIVLASPALRKDLLLRLGAPVEPPRLHFYDYPNCFTPWVQDYFLRLTDGSKSFLLPTYSSNLQINECKPFELGIADHLAKLNPSAFGRLEDAGHESGKAMTDLFHLMRVDRKSGDLYGNADAYQRLFPVKTLRLLYGEGGMRIPTNSYLFIERSDWYKTREEYQINSMEPRRTAAEYYERVLGKKVVPVGTALPPNTFYSYHIDMFMTPVESPTGEVTIFFGHPEATEKIVSQESLLGLPGFDATLWRTKILEANQLERELKDKKFRVVRIPILFLQGRGGGFRPSRSTMPFNPLMEPVARHCLCRATGAVPSARSWTFSPRIWPLPLGGSISILGSLRAEMPF